MVSIDPADAFASVRLVFKYGPEGIELIERLPLDKRIPLSDDFDPSELSGIFLELRAADDSVRFRRDLGEVVPFEGEAVDDDGKLFRIPLPVVPIGMFSVITPDDAAAEDVVLLASADALPSLLAQGFGLVLEEGAREIRRFPFRDDGSGGDVEV